MEAKGERILRETLSEKFDTAWFHYRAYHELVNPTEEERFTMFSKFLDAFYLLPEHEQERLKLTHQKIYFY